MTVTVSAALGGPSARTKKPAKNNLADVRAIQTLLRDIYAEPRVNANGKCDANTIQAIKNFQGLWRGVTPDGRVDPAGKTLKRLNTVASPMSLKSIKLKRVVNGGYQVQFNGEAPPAPYQLFLALASKKKNKMFVEPLRNNELINQDNLPMLLYLISEANVWGRTAMLKLLVARGQHYISESAGQALRCSVKPYQGLLDPVAIGAEKGLDYTGNGTGRILHMPAINGDYYFVWAGKFVTDNAMRGFDCTTYAGAVYGVDATTGAMSGYGTKLADHIGAEKCDMEQKKADDIKDFFAKNNTGTYIMWNSGHVVLVHDGVVHEFSKSAGGYRSTTVQDWKFQTRGSLAYYWIRKVSADFGSFEPGAITVIGKPI